MTSGRSPEEATVTKSELIERIAARQEQLSPKDVEMAVKMIMEEMARALINNRRIEIRGFGSFLSALSRATDGAQSQTGGTVELPGKWVPHFKPGKELRERVNATLVE